MTRNAMMPQLTTTDSGICRPPMEIISTFSSSFRAAVNAFIVLPPSAGSRSEVERLNPIPFSLDLLSVTF